MTLIPGTKLGPYEILAPLGAGGMGEVYRARDTRLDRTVAIKVLPETLAADPQFRERFDREARTISQLDHANICALYDVGSQQGLSYLVMQYLEGQTLEDRLKRGALPLDQALAIAIQIARALDRAHRAGIVHRDLKPGNIFLVRAGASPVAKLLDFGLAKTSATGAGVASVASTTPATLTAAGTILGTFQYMAPEQLEGHEADARTDIFAFGAVVYEMVTGRRAFEAKSQASLIAKILESEPPAMSTLQPIAPATLDRVVNKCLAKDADARWQSAADLATELQWIADQPPGARVQGRAARVWPWAALATVAAVLACAAGFAWWRATRPIERPLIRMSMPLVVSQKIGTALTSGELDSTLLMNRVPGTSLAISPDGSRLVATVLDADGRQRLAMRRLDQDRFNPLPGSDDATAPFFSPDGQWVAFFADGKLKKLPIEGGSAVPLCDAGTFASGTWADNGTIIAALGSSNTNTALSGVLAQIPEGGGVPTPITKLVAGETQHARPQVLPGGDSVLFTAYSGAGAANAHIDILSLRTHARKSVSRGGEIGRYVQAPDGSGYLTYLVGQTLFAAPFDLASLSVTGAAKRILDDMSSIHTTAGDFDVSQTGTLVYYSGPASAEQSLFWLDPTGRTEPLHAEHAFYSGLRFSPDGTRLLFIKAAGVGQADLWVQDLQRDTVQRLTSFDGSVNSPVWSPDGRYVLFAHRRQSYWMRSDGVGEPQVVGSAEGIPLSISPDGTHITYAGGNPFTAQEVSIVPFEGPEDHPRLGKPEPFATAPGFAMPVFSPDGHWIAYQSAETGTAQVYVQPFPGPGPKVAVSIDGGRFPAWSASAHEMFFVDLTKRIMVDDYSIRDGRFVSGQPKVWSSHPILFPTGGGPTQPYALAPDGQRFAVLLYPDGSTEDRRPLHLTFLFNFVDELRRQFGR